MKNDYDQMGKKLIEELGGSDNVSKMYHCATRLRVDVIDKDKINLDNIKATKGVLGAVESMGGVQIIIGNEVSKVYKAIMSGDNKTTEVDKGAKDEGTGVVSKILNTLSAIIGPTIPVVMCGGLISALLVILTNLGLSPESHTYMILSMVSTAAQYFMPVLLAYTCAKKFGCDIMISVFLGAVLISPTLIELAEAGGFVNLFVLPVRVINYSSTLIPIILTIYAFKYIEKLVDKFVPAVVKFVFKPFFCIVIMVPIMLCITGPIGSYCGDLLLMLMFKINEVAPWASVLVVGGLAPLLVLTGMHFALLPLVMAMFANGYDNMLFVAFIGMNFSQFGVSLACMLKTKNKNLRTLASSCAITSFLAGVTEPTLYGICIRMKKPLIATWIACCANAIYCAIFGVKVFSFGAPSFFTLPIFLNPDGTMSNFYFAIGAVILTIVVSFVATWVIGFDDSVYDEETA